MLLLNSLDSYFTEKNNQSLLIRIKTVFIMFHVIHSHIETPYNQLYVVKIKICSKYIF